MKRLTALIPILAMALAACAGPGLFASEPMGKQLDRALKQIEEQCRASGAPPFGPNKPGQFETACLMFTLKPWEIGDTPESVLAHAIKLPAAHDKPRNVYKPGMSSGEYFKALCKEAAGEWVFRRVKNVDGIRQERPNRRQQVGEAQIVFWATEPVVEPIGVPSDIFDETTRAHWKYFERRLASAEANAKGGVYEYFDSTVRDGRVIAKAQSNFAFLSRGVRLPHDREHAIRGSEFIIFQVEPFEVLAFRRTLAHLFVDRPDGDPRSLGRAGCPGSYSGPFEFLRAVLTPVPKR